MATSLKRRLYAAAVITSMSAACGAQPEGMIDPLYDHPCNQVIDARLAGAGKEALRDKLLSLDAPYRKGVELAAAGRPDLALQQLLTYLRSISGVLATTHHVYVDALLLAASMKAELRQMGDALEDARAAVATRTKCLGPDDAFTLQALSVLAKFQERAGDWEAALKVSAEIAQRQRERVTRAYGAASPAERKRLVVAESNVAALAYRAREYEVARQGAEATVKAAATLPSEDLERYELANTAWYVIDRIAYLRKDVDGQRRAIKGLHESYQALRARIGQEHPRTLPLLANVGFAVADVSPKEAVPILGDYVALVEGERLRATLARDRQVVLESRANTYQRFAFAAHEAGRTQDAFWGTEWSKARALRDEVTIRNALADPAIADDDRRALAASERQIAQLEKLLESDAVDKGKRADAALALLNEKRTYARLFTAAEAKSSRLRLASQSAIQKPDNVGDVLKPDEAFVSYLTRRVDGPLFEVLIAVLEPTGKLTVAGPIEVVGLEQLVSSFVEILSTAGGLDVVARKKELLRIGDAFFLEDIGKTHKEAKVQATVEPLRAVLSEKLLPGPIRNILAPYERWIISAAGVLWSVPFEALNDGNGLILDSRIVSYVHSWTMLSLLNGRANRRQAPTTAELLAIGGATYEDRVLPAGARANAFPAWHELKFSAAELEGVADVYKLVEGKTLFRGRQATREMLAMLDANGTLGSARRILLSAHGYLNLSNPSDSAIVLGRPPNGTEADRYLSARDIARMTINADVVVVSSCDSGRGRVAAGEGVLGLPYAFFSAGAQSTVLTLWGIYDDANTAKIVRDFMSALRRGVRSDQALTLAKRGVRKTSDESTWAAFSLIGR